MHPSVVSISVLILSRVTANNLLKKTRLNNDEAYYIFSLSLSLSLLLFKYNCFYDRYEWRRGHFASLLIISSYLYKNQCGFFIPFLDIPMMNLTRWSNDRHSIQKKNIMTNRPTRSLRLIVANGTFQKIQWSSFQDCRQLVAFKTRRKRQWVNGKRGSKSLASPTLSSGTRFRPAKMINAYCSII